MGEETERIEHDQYFTDPAVALAGVKRFQTVWKALSPIRQPPQRFLEPSVGQGAFSDAIRAVFPDAYIVGVDIDDRMESHAMRSCNKFVCSDFLDTTTKTPFDAVIGNFPFIYALEHYLHSLTLVKEGGCVSSLLKLAFKGSITRYEAIWKKDVRHKCYDATYVPRPSFVYGTTDAQEYAQFMWFKGINAPGITGEPIKWR